MAVECGPVGTWAGAGATVLVVIVTVLVALGYFDAFRRPRIHITFEPAQPGCRYGTTEHEGTALWVRIGVENRGVAPARGCVGRLIAVTTDSELRHDVDPVQLRWAGLPRARAFDPMDLRSRPTRIPQRALRAGGVALGVGDIRRSRLRSRLEDRPAGRPPTGLSDLRVLRQRRNGDQVTAL